MRWPASPGMPWSVRVQRQASPPSERAAITRKAAGSALMVSPLAGSRTAATIGTARHPGDAPTSAHKTRSRAAQPGEGA